MLGLGLPRRALGRPADKRQPRGHGRLRSESSPISPTEFVKEVGKAVPSWADRPDVAREFIIALKKDSRFAEVYFRLLAQGMRLE
jgi:hypothetical protein